jgi:flagellar P-ring protein precursor FlgI
VPQGAIVEKENPNRFAFADAQSIDWIIHDPDFTTAIRLADAVNDAFDEDVAAARDGGTVRVKVPPRYLGRQVELVAVVEGVNVTVDALAKVVINERTGTVVMGGEVSIAPVAVAHGGLNIEVQQQNTAVQAGAFSRATNTAVRNTSVDAEEDSGALVTIEGVTIAELVDGLNQLGVKPRDLIQILLTIKAAGALHAELEVM